ncbi:hypothetical protein [Nonomuraea diastatica]|uniref:PASTA domain-containing protein n=1 Tax=Nonomuraea diastatica TaxID=1848329 RepID=A0A4R4WTJ8_9ACTN|nr:hypothetical protein [Nonomuraea diastatica]TDD20926.1 hypothetical protein E1294_16175 [Nonomuraea diastatica]
MNQNMDHVVTRFAAPPVTETGEGARELMHAIMATEPPPAKARRRPNRRLAVAAGAVLTGAVMAATWVLPTSSASALDIEEKNGYYVIQIKDLYANPEIYETQLKDHGLDVTLKVKPVTAAFEGQVFPTSPDHKYITDIKGIYPPGPCDKLDGCAIGVKIPVGYTDTVDIRVGRKARPGEKYTSITSFDAKGEPMECVPYHNKTVAEVRDLLKERGVRIGNFVIDDPDSDDPQDFTEASSAPDSLLVTGGALREPGVTSLHVSSVPTPGDVVERRYRKNGCPTS